MRCHEKDTCTFALIEDLSRCVMKDPCPVSYLDRRTVIGLSWGMGLNLGYFDMDERCKVQTSSIRDAMFELSSAS
jgi:hypothetical protein